MTKCINNQINQWLNKAMAEELNAKINQWLN